MKKLNKIVMVLFVSTLLYNCSNPEKEQITNALDYNKFLEVEGNTSLEFAQNEITFWNNKLKRNPIAFPYLSKKAAAQKQLFDATGSIDYLKKAEQNLIEANEIANYKRAGLLRSLARNYISQHRFKEALELLKKAEVNGENLKGTQKMLFDVHLELGNTKLAKQYLEKIVNFNDFDYLIRTSKWSDYKGDLDNAIKYLEKALVKVETAKNKSTMQWAYTNLADYYGHAGRIQNSYNHYLKSLALNPNDAYAKRGIAWIVYSYERNPKEALRILDAITEDYNAPDYALLKAEIYEYMNQSNQKEKHLKNYDAAVANTQYGDMYNAYNVKLNNDRVEYIEDALKLAKREIENRPTALSYDLLAWTYFNMGKTKEALEVVETNVLGKTSEPEVLYHIAEIYKANGNNTVANNLKPELLESVYELGPLAEQKINQL